MAACPNIPNWYQHGHAFIADRYKRVRMVTKNTYRWVYDVHPTRPDGSLIPVPYVEEKTEYIYHSPYISMIGFNWGWGSSNENNSQWYALTGDWFPKENHSEWNYKNNREMICDFKIRK
jgi:hypothetical protein